MHTEDYSVRLESFQGPLDLLLHLIRRAEVDINTISIASITDQYLHHLDALASIDVEPAGEFLVTAATLIELKSRMLVPPEDAGDEDPAASIIDRDATDPAAELVRALLQYKRFREAAEALEQRRATWRLRYETRPLALPDAPASDADPEAPLDLDDITLFDLVQAYARIADTVIFERLQGHAVLDDDTPIELHAADLIDRLRNAPTAPNDTDTPWAGRHALPMRSLFTGRSRIDVIGLFLAVLELVRQRVVIVHQNDLDREVTIALAEDAAESTPTPAPST
ncbi:MAG: segregation/condensation protein A [Phycisphaerae bacterium]|nr:segregation/condensation protein A [Phycisphaerae bacterium]